MNVNFLGTLFALATLFTGCIVSEDEVDNGGAEAGTTAGVMAGMTAGTVMGGTNTLPPCDPNSPTIGAPEPDLPEQSEAPAELPEDCRALGCGDGGSCEMTNEEERCEQYPPFEQCLCDAETGEVVCQEVSPSDYCYTVVTFECVPVVPPAPPADECNGVPNPSVTCLQTGCDEGFICVPADNGVCVPSNCSCNQSVWACTADCGQSFECIPE